MGDTYDGTDLDAIDGLLIHPGTALVRARIQSEIERRQAELEQDLDEVKTAKCRGRIAGLRTALEVPNILREDIARGLKTKERDDGN